LSPLDGEIALSHKLSDSGARVLVTSNLSALLPTALKFLAKGLLDRLIVCEDDDWGKVGTPQTALPDNPQNHHLQAIHDGATKPAQWPQLSADDVPAAIYRRHHRPAQGRDAQPRQSDVGGVGLRRLGQAGARRAQRRSSA
jgi:Long-chain acyl-CoA synthetases (AMP-forming)